mmetsp:Transcript_11686/g.33648  ORF Transcript_11686/g.33648 Transcript_11686/m.33648 type:complete len:278 (-) Transcript_11686:1354-2187(-)
MLRGFIGKSTTFYHSACWYCRCGSSLCLGRQCSFAGLVILLLLLLPLLGSIRAGRCVAPAISTHLFGTVLDFGCILLRRLCGIIAGGILCRRRRCSCRLAISNDLLLVLNSLQLLLQFKQSFFGSFFRLSFVFVLPIKLTIFGLQIFVFVSQQLQVNMKVLDTSIATCDFKLELFQQMKCLPQSNNSVVSSAIVCLCRRRCFIVATGVVICIGAIGCWSCRRLRFADCLLRYTGCPWCCRCRWWRWFIATLGCRQWRYLGSNCSVGPKIGLLRIWSR